MDSGFQEHNACINHSFVTYASFLCVNSQGVILQAMSRTLYHIAHQFTPWNQYIQQYCVPSAAARVSSANTAAL